MKTTINERIAQLISKVARSQSAFAASLGKKGGSISPITTGKSKPGFELLELIIDTYPQVSADWLMKGEGQMFKKAVDPNGQGDGYLMKYIAELERSNAEKSKMIELLLSGKSEGVRSGQNDYPHIWVAKGLLPPFFSTFGASFGVHHES